MLPTWKLYQATIVRQTVNESSNIARMVVLRNEFPEENCHTLFGSPSDPHNPKYRCVRLERQGRRYGATEAGVFRQVSGLFRLHLRIGPLVRSGRES
jgi:hypothetical protein